MKSLPYIVEELNHGIDHNKKKNRMIFDPVYEPINLYAYKMRLNEIKSSLTTPWVTPGFNQLLTNEINPI